MAPRLADRFRTAIASGAYWTAEELLVEYRREVEQRWQAAQSDTERGEIKHEVDVLLTWARRLTLVRKSQAGAKLMRLTSQRAYSGGVSRPTRVWEMQG
jgi:hypothetical protein